MGDVFLTNREPVMAVPKFTKHYQAYRKEFWTDGPVGVANLHGIEDLLGELSVGVILPYEASLRAGTSDRRRIWMARRLYKQVFHINRSLISMDQISLQCFSETFQKREQANSAGRVMVA